MNKSAKIVSYEVEMTEQALEFFPEAIVESMPEPSFLAESDIISFFGCLKHHTIPTPDTDLTAHIATDLPSTADGILHW